MKRHGEAFVGIDAAKARNAVAVAEGGRDGEVRCHGEFDNTHDGIAKLICKNRYSTCRTVSDGGVPTASLSVPRPDALPSSPAPSAPRYAAAGLDRSARPRDPH